MNVREMLSRYDWPEEWADEPALAAALLEASFEGMTGADKAEILGNALDLIGE